MPVSRKGNPRFIKKNKKIFILIFGAGSYWQFVLKGTKVEFLFIIGLPFTFKSINW